MRGLYQWMMHWAETPQAEKMLGVLSFAESSFFPIPPDVLLIPMAVATPKKAIRYGAITSVASVLGGVVGYLIGYLFRGGPAPFPSLLLADVDCDGDVDIADNTFLTAWFFQGGPAPTRPCFEYGD